jgi:hypothetical protein
MDIDLAKSESRASLWIRVFAALVVVTMFSVGLYAALKWPGCWFCFLLS